jgi:hypothetical protein
VKVSSVSAWSAHGLAWIAGIWLALGPVYQGVSPPVVVQSESVSPASGNEAAIPVLDDESGGETKRFTATLIEQNGLWVLWLLLVPVLLTGNVLRAVWQNNARNALLWGIALALLGLCVLAGYSIGVFYLPAALALVFTAFTYSRGRSVA